MKRRKADVIDKKWRYAAFSFLLAAVWLLGAGCGGRRAEGPAGAEDRTGSDRLFGAGQETEETEQAAGFEAGQEIEETEQAAGLGAGQETEQAAGKAGLAAADPEKGGEETAEDAPRLSVVTTVFPYHDFVRQIAGDKVKLRLVVPAGMDSHSFEPTPADMIHIQQSDIFIYNGGEMERWVDEVLESVETQDIRVVSMMDSVELLEEEVVEGMEEDEHHDHGSPADPSGGEAAYGYDAEAAHAGDGGGYDDRPEHDRPDHAGYEPGQLHEVEYDEHIWTSPVNAMKIVEQICQVLSEEDPDNQAFYKERTRQYIERLKALDESFRQVVEDGKWDMIVVGDRFPFRYLVESYGLRYRAAFAGCAGDTEPSARTIAYLIGQVKERQLPAVYYLELSSQRVAQIIGEETGARVLLLHSCHNVTRREFEEGVTYLQLMEQNVEGLRIGLGADG